MCKIKEMERDSDLQRATNGGEKFDVGTFVVTCHIFQNRMEPFMNILRALDHLRRWESPALSLVFLMSSVTINEWSPVYLVLIVLFMWFPVLIVTGFRRLGANKHVRPSSRMNFVRRRGDRSTIDAKRTATLKAKIHMQEYIHILSKAQSAMENFIDWMEFFTSIIVWEKWRHTIGFLFGIAGSVCLVCYVPQKHLVSCGFLAFFLFNSHFLRILLRVRNWFMTVIWKNMYRRVIKMLGLDDDIISYTLRDSNGDDWYDAEVDVDEDKDNEGQTEEEHDETDNMESEDITSEKKDSSKSLLTQWTDFRRRRKQFSSGNCTSCNVSFSTILKKRQYCRNCGGSFCSKCCSNRVPRAALGATAPAAYEETVLVCKSCFGYLKSIQEANDERTEFC